FGSWFLNKTCKVLSGRRAVRRKIGDVFLEEMFVDLRTDFLCIAFDSAPGLGPKISVNSVKEAFAFQEGLNFLDVFVVLETVVGAVVGRGCGCCRRRCSTGLDNDREDARVT